MNFRRFPILMSLLLLFLLPVFSGTETKKYDTVFQIRWHVENHEGEFCTLKIMDYNAFSEKERDSVDDSGPNSMNVYDFDLAYSSDWQGLCVLWYKTNILNRGNHHIALTFSPLAHTGHSSLAYGVDLIVGNRDILDFDTVHNKWFFLSGYSESETTCTIDDVTQSGCDIMNISFPVEHPYDQDRQYVNIYIPMRIKVLHPETGETNVTYVANITIAVVSS